MYRFETSIVSKSNFMYRIDLRYVSTKSVKNELRNFCEYGPRSLLKKRLLKILTDKQKCGIHDRRSVEHGSHENIVAGAIYEADVTDEIVAETVHDERIFLGGAH